jgi:predicted dehydrogenase
MRRLGMGLIGAGFVGPHHVDAVRRLGYVDIVAVAGSTDASAAKKAADLGARKGYGEWHALLADPDVHVVHNATPNHLHFPITAAALKAGKHVISDKPLALTSAESRELVRLAREAGVVHAVTFNYRGNPLVQHARTAIAAGELGRPYFIHGHYLQDWLIKDTDYSWRLEPDKGGVTSALGDIGSHWCDLAQHVSGLRITEVLADITTVVPVRKKPAAARDAFQAASAGDAFVEVPMTMEDLASVLIRFENGAKGSFSVAQVCAGHKNDLVLEICGSAASMTWRQEAQNELWIGHRDRASERLQKDPSLMNAGGRAYAHLPGGHQESWADAFSNLMRDIYGVIAAGQTASTPHPPAFATFDDGLRANCLVDAMLESAGRGGVWTKVSA